MKLRLVARVLALLSAMISIFMFWPLFWAFLDGTPDVKAFSVSIAIGFLIAAFLYIWGRQDSFQDIGIREAFAVVTLSWVTASIIGGLPYLLNGTAATFTDAFLKPCRDLPLPAPLYSQILKQNQEAFSFGVILPIGLAEWEL